MNAAGPELSVRSTLGSSHPGLALKNAVNSQGQPSGISSINDIAVLKNAQTCAASRRPKRHHIGGHVR